MLSTKVPSFLLKTFATFKIFFFCMGKTALTLESASVPDTHNVQEDRFHLGGGFSPVSWPQADTVQEEQRCSGPDGRGQWHSGAMRDRPWT